MKEYARSFYEGMPWRRTREAYQISQDFICERCGGLASLVHHKVWITPKNINDPDITLNWDNLEALCMDCHNVEHMTGKACIDGLRFDKDGNLIKK